MKFLLVDDHILFIEGLKGILQKHLTECEIIAATSVEEAYRVINENPDIALILADLAMPNADGINLIRYIEQHKILIPIAVLSASEDLFQIQNAMQAGALGFIPKAYESNELIAAIDEIISGNIHLPHFLAKRIESSVKNITNKHEIAHQHGITPRQLEVLSLVEKGLSNLKIADVLCISEHTVKSHMKQIFQKIDTINRVECISKAKLLGML